jgi:hypothetical protein
MNNRIRLIIGLLICLGISGCGDGLPSDPVSDYQKHVEAYMADFKEDQGLLAVSGSYKFDVETTDSLVSPLIGKCIVRVTHIIEPMKGTSILLTHEINMKHAFQGEKKWVMTTAKVKTIKGAVVKAGTQNPETLDAVIKSMEGRSFDLSEMRRLSKNGG